MKMKKRSWKVLALMLCLSMAFALVAACAGDNGNDTDTGASSDSDYTGSTHLEWAHGVFPTSLDPHLAFSMPCGQIKHLIYDTLFFLDYDMNVVPSVAESYEFIDAQTIVFQIREGIRFSNGDPLTPDDVAFTLNNASVAPQVALVLDMIDRVEVTGENEVTMFLEFPFAPILHHLSHFSSSITSRAVLEELGGPEAHQNAPVGSGPFMVTNMVAGDRVEMAVNPYYWGGPFGDTVVLETITIRAIPDESMRALELEAEAVDLISNVGFMDVNRLQADPDVTMLLTTNLSAGFLGMNNTLPPFDDVRVRQAIGYAVDDLALIEVVHQGLTQPLHGHLADAVWGSISAELPGRPFNPERARELLAEAGHPDGFSATISLNETVERIGIATVLQAQLRLVGIELEIEILEWGAYLDATGRGEAEMFLLGWVTMTGDPDYGLFPPFHSSAAGFPGNRSFFNNARVDELLELGRTTVDSDARLAYYAEAQQIIFENQPVYWLHGGVERFATGSNWEGLRLHPAAIHRFHLLREITD